MENIVNLPKCRPDKCMPAHIRKWAPPQCPVKAVIPLIETATEENIKTLSNCFVHVQSTNKTYYIDNQHRFILCWSGMVFPESYDFEENPLNLRGQIVPDFANNQIVIYDNLGEYITIGGGGADIPAVSNTDWSNLWN